MIDITGTDLRKFVAKAYDLSEPVGMGYLHYQPGPIPEHEIDKVLNSRYANQPGDGPIVNMDYVMGRCVKMSVYRQGDRLLIGDRWYDHNDRQMQELLSAEGVVNNGPHVAAA